jgi:acyl-CoA reductase-like NAD-dependent aldehyde dehydrogenase
MVVAEAPIEGSIDSLESRNPVTGEVVGVVPVMGEQGVNAAVERARVAADTWQNLSFATRREHLLAWRRTLATRADELADLIRQETGKPASDAISEVFLALSHLTYAATHAERALRPRNVLPGLLANMRATISYHPLGVVAVIGPWNYPLFTPMGSIAYALAAGNAVVFKPSELTPLVGQMCGETLAEAIPVPNLLQVVTGDGRTGAALARAEINKLAFTGSAATGKRVMAAAAERLTPVVLELGGKDPLIVTADADIDRAAEGAVFGAFTNAGQACVSVERAYVVDSVYEQFVDRVADEANQLITGALDTAHIGAITRPEQIKVIRDQVEDALNKGATALVGGPDSFQGNFVSPIVLTDVTPDMKIMQEETFGPVLPIVRVRSVDEAVTKANASRYGLGSSIFGRQGVREIASRLRAGMTAINTVIAYSGIPGLPFGGVGESGFGRIHGDEGLREFTRIKSTSEERIRLPFNLLSFRQPSNAYANMRTMIMQLFGGGVVDQISSSLRKSPLGRVL